jgi:hypothetical protein
MVDSSTSAMARLDPNSEDVELQDRVEQQDEGGDFEAAPTAEKLAPQVMLAELENVNVLGKHAASSDRC